ncbi:MAG TPA: hypothetical protein VGN73_06965 [Gemmatimonadaceae bacterium]|nr:hypothetical protein [Gemmatimonadaceae bacterium]
MSTNAFSISRVFRFNDANTGAAQISVFPEGAPQGESDLEIRIKHFTEIENFGFLGFVLSHELGGKARQRVRALDNLNVEDAEVQGLVLNLRQAALTNEALGDELLDVDINWEHFVASTNDKLIPGDPLKVSDAQLQTKIDALDELSEALVREINQRSQERTARRRRIRQVTRIAAIVGVVAVLIVLALLVR